MQEVSPDSATRANAEAMTQELSKFSTELSLNRDVYDARRAGPQERRTPRRSTTSSARCAELPPERRRQGRRDAQSASRKAQDELVLVAAEFARNIRADRLAHHLTAAELDGLPADFHRAPQPDAEGRVALTMEYPDYIQVTPYARNDDLRRRAFMAYQPRLSRTWRCSIACARSDSSWRSCSGSRTGRTS
jgi:thimet oligopeptidase